MCISGLGAEAGSEIGQSRESLASMPSYGIRDAYGAAGRLQKTYTGSNSSSSLTLPSNHNNKSSPGQHRSIRGNMSDTGGTTLANVNSRGSLNRKAISLEQTASADEQVLRVLFGSFNVLDYS